MGDQRLLLCLTQSESVGPLLGQCLSTSRIVEASDRMVKVPQPSCRQGAGLHQQPSAPAIVADAVTGPEVGPSVSPAAPLAGADAEIGFRRSGGRVHGLDKRESAGSETRRRAT
jgi:hypothetical protein